MPILWWTSCLMGAMWRWGTCSVFLCKKCACSLALPAGAAKPTVESLLVAALPILTICNAALMSCSPTARGAALTPRHPSSTLDISVCQALPCAQDSHNLYLCGLQVTADRVPEYIDLLIQSRLAGVLQPELAAVLEGMGHLLNDSAMELMRRWAPAFRFKGPVACCSAGDRAKQ